MKKVVSVVLALTLTVFALCACHGKTTSANHTTKTSCTGMWICKTIPESMKDYQSITLSIQGGKFTYWLNNGKTTKITDGHYQSTGDKSLALYPETLSEIHNSTNTTISEKTLASSEKEKQQGTATLQDNGSLRISVNSFTLDFVKK